MGKGGKNSDSTLSVNDGQQQQNSSSITTLNPKTPSNSDDLRRYTWNEIHQHASKTDRWLVIDKRVYDITCWAKHPGGQNVLKHYAGQDATEAFRALHPDLSRAEKYLKTFYIGDVVEEDEMNSVSNDQTLKDDFERVRQTAISRVRFFCLKKQMKKTNVYRLETLPIKSLVFSSYLFTYSRIRICRLFCSISIWNKLDTVPCCSFLIHRC